jgi:hypothetical protein
MSGSTSVSSLNRKIRGLKREMDAIKQDLRHGELGSKDRETYEGLLRDIMKEAKKLADKLRKKRYTRRRGGNQRGVTARRRR